MWRGTASAAPNPGGSMPDGDDIAVVACFDQIAVEERAQTTQGFTTEGAFHLPQASFGKEPADGAVTVIGKLAVVKVYGRDKGENYTHPP